MTAEADSSATPATPPPRPVASDLPELPAQVQALLNLGHAIDHMFLLVFAAAVSRIAPDFGLAGWEDLMPYGVGAFVMFGLGSLPSGRLGDLWGRRRMMLVFFFGMGFSALLASQTRNAWQMAAALTLLGCFASIYHPVGIPMLVQAARQPGRTIGFNGLSGNLGMAVAALLTGLIIKWLGWRMAFALPGLFSLAAGWAFAQGCPAEREAPAKRKSAAPIQLEPAVLARALLVMTSAAVTGSILFNLTTNGNGPLLAERFRGLIEDPAVLGVMLGGVYAVASLAQVVVGRLIDRVPLKPLMLGIVLAQIPALLLASQTQGWAFYLSIAAVMTMTFGAIPFIDVMIVRYVDDRLRSRVSGLRLAISLGVSSLAVWALGPAVKGFGFATVLALLAGLSACTAAIVALLPKEPARP